jgi:hypothetical protein
VPELFLRQVFDVMVRTPQDTYPVLTKRAERLARVATRLPWPRNVARPSSESGSHRDSLAPPQHNFRFELEFESEELRQKWIAAAGHQRVWPPVERTMTTVKDTDPALCDSPPLARHRFTPLRILEPAHENCSSLSKRQNREDPK